MTFPRAKMLYDDGKYYKWTANADHDNPYYRGGNDRSQLNRTEGYEVQYFIEHSVQKMTWKNTPDITDCQKIEKMIREDVPPNLHKRELIFKWIDANYNTVKF